MTAVALDSPDLGQRARKHRLTSTIGAGLLNTNTSLSVVTGFLALPGSQYFGVAISQFLLWYTIFTLATAASLPLIGKMTTILGVRFVTILSGLVVTASIISLTFVENNIFIYYAICVPYGIGWGGCTVLPANTLATAWHQHKRRGTILGFVAMGSGLGAFVWGIVFPPIIAGGGFHGGLYAVAAFSFLLTVVNGLVLVRNPQGVAGRKAEAEAIAAGTGTRASIDRSSLLLGFGGVVAVLVVLAFTFALETSFSQMSGAVYAGSGVSLTVAGFLVSYYSIVSIDLQKPFGSSRLLLHTVTAAIFAADTIPTQHLVYFGGPTTGPGYEFHEFVGRGGLSQRLEYRFLAPFVPIPLGRFGRAPGTITLAPFATAVWIDRSAPFKSARQGWYPALGLGALTVFDVLRLDVARGLRDGRWTFSVDIGRDFWSVL